MDDSVYLIYIVPELTIRTVWTIIENQPTNMSANFVFIGNF